MDVIGGTEAVPRADEFAPDALPTAHRGWTGSAAAWVALAILLPVVTYVGVRPDWYFRLNGLDSYFYTGYAQNFGNILAMNGETHYFVSRWSLYLPNRLAFKLFGAEGGYLAVRWCAGVIVAASVIALGRNRWRRSDILALAVLALASPLVLRTVFTDYADSVTVPLGVLAITTVSLRPDSRWSAAAIGLCGAGMAIANPLAASVVLCLLPAWFICVRTWRQRAILAAIAAAVGGGVVIAGWALFRMRYGIPNVYRPTIEFLRANSNYQDPLKSPRLWWMGYRIWIYVPLLVLFAWAYLIKAKRVVFDRPETCILLTMGTQYVFQIWYQFGRHGSTLELPYYWSLMVPSLVLASVVLLGKLAQLTSALLLPGLVAAWILSAHVFRSEYPEVFSSWLDALLIVLLVAAIWHRFGGARPALMVASTFVLLVAFQVGAPRPEPLLPGESFVPVSYERVFDWERSEGIDGYHAATWFVAEMQQLDPVTQQSASFWIGGRHAHQMAAMYNAHVIGRWLNAGWGAEALGTSLSAESQVALETGTIPVVAMLGAPEDIAAMTNTLDQLKVVATPILEATAPDALGTMVRVVRVRLP